MNYKTSLTAFAMAILSATALVAPSLTSAQQKAPSATGPREPLSGDSIATEAYRRGLNLVGSNKPSDNPQTDRRYAHENRAFLNNPVKGTFGKYEHGLYTIRGMGVLLMNVDFRDRGYVKEADKYIEQFLGKPAEGICQVILSTGPLVCDVFVMEGGKEVNLGEELLRRGWYGWVRETGGAASKEGTRAATEAYWQRRGVWSNPWYFPEGGARHMYQRIILK